MLGQDGRARHLLGAKGQPTVACTAQPLCRCVCVRVQELAAARAAAEAKEAKAADAEAQLRQVWLGGSFGCAYGLCGFLLN